MKHVEPMCAPLVTEISFALCDLVGVVGECVVDTAAVDVEILAQVLHGDSGALDMPTGITETPGTVPFQLLILNLGFGEPEHEVGLVALCKVLFNAVAHTNCKVLASCLLNT